MKRTLLGYDVDHIVNVLSNIEGPYQSIKCGCQQLTCQDWFVTGIDETFDEKRAKAIAGLLNLMEEK